MRRSAAMFVTLVCVLSGAAGCGDEDGEELSEEAYLEAGNAVCAEGNATLDAAGEEIFVSEGQPEAEAVRTFLRDTVVPTVEGMIEDITALEGPADLEEKTDELRAEVESALEIVEGAIDDEDPTTLFERGDPFERADAIADEMGLTDCAGDDD